MPPPLNWTDIDLETIRDSVGHYTDHVPSNLQELEEFRLRTIPNELQGRKKADDSGSFLEKDELLKLVEWKLKHGTFRPTLMKLVAGNAEEAIRNVTTQAYATYSARNSSEALALLTKLSGIGPATASLVLSVYDIANAPFFSDELFRYLHAEATPNGGLKGWDRKIGYTKKEYEQICDRVRQMQQRLQASGKGESGDREGEGGITALDLEKLAYVLARSTSSSSAGNGSGVVADKKRKVEEVQQIETSAEKQLEVSQEGRYPSRKRGKT